MSESESPRVLLVTSAGASPDAVTPVLAALEATDLQVRAIDIGRAGARSEGVLDWVVRPFASDFAERRLHHEMDERPPDVAVTFDPVTTNAMASARDEASRPTPVLAVVNELVPGSDWGATDADRYLTIDDTAAVALSDMGLDGERVMSMGPICELAFAAAGKTARDSLRSRFGLEDQPVVLIHADGFGYELTSQVALQLSLINTRVQYLFDAGRDAEAATALRRQVPTLELDAKLFGETEDAPLLWRCADIIVARPSAASVARSMVLGAYLVSFSIDDKDKDLVRAMEERKRGGSANNALLLSSALEPLLGKTRKKDALVGADGAGTAADIAWILAEERSAIIEERRSAVRDDTRTRVEAAVNAAESAARSTAAAGGLEDLSGGDDARPSATNAPDSEELARLKAEVSARLNQISKTVSESHKAADRWTNRAVLARKKGQTELVRKAEQSADAERARMHASLAEMAQLQSEISRLERAAQHAPPPRRTPDPQPEYGDSAASRTRSSSSYSSIDDELSGLKQKYGAGNASIDSELGNMKRKRKKQSASLDDELAALKRKMRNKKRR